LETDFFIVGFFTVADLLAGVAFLVAPGLAVRDDFERAGDFLAAEVATGAGEARGDGRGDDIAWVMLALIVEDDGSGGGESCKEPCANQDHATLYPWTEPSASHHVWGYRALLIAKPYLDVHSHRPSPPYKTSTPCGLPT